MKTLVRQLNAIVALYPACKTCKKRHNDLHMCGKCKQAIYCNADCQKLDWIDSHAQLCLIDGKNKRDREPDDPKVLEKRANDVVRQLFGVIANNEAALEELVNVVTLQELRNWAIVSPQFRRVIVRNPKFWWIFLKRMQIVPEDEPFNLNRSEWYITRGRQLLFEVERDNLLYNALQAVSRNESALTVLLNTWGISRQDIIDLNSTNSTFRELFAQNNFFWYVISKFYDVIPKDTVYDQNTPYVQRAIVELPAKRYPKYEMSLYWNGEPTNYYSAHTIGDGTEDPDQVENNLWDFVNQYLFESHYVPKYHNYSISMDDTNMYGYWYDNDDTGRILGDGIDPDDIVIPTRSDYPNVETFWLKLYVEYETPDIDIKIVNDTKLESVPVLEDSISFPWELLAETDPLREEMMQEFRNQWWPQQWVGDNPSDYYLSISYDFKTSEMNEDDSFNVPSEVYDITDGPYRRIMQDLDKLSVSNYAEQQELEITVNILHIYLLFPHERHNRGFS